MRQLYPTDASAAADPLDIYGNDDRPARADRPWVVLNMVASVDGQATISGRSGGLGGPGDKAVFGALRAIADVILVGSGTVNAEGYGPPKPSREAIAARLARGQTQLPQIAIVTASLRLDDDLALLAGESRPLVITTASADPARREHLGDRVELVEAGQERVDLGDALAMLGSRGARIVLCEGGPTLNAQLIDAGLVDELCLTVAPCFVGGNGPGISRGAPAQRRDLELDRVLEDGGFIFYRYLFSHDG